MQVTEQPEMSHLIIQFQPEKVCELPGFYVNPQDCRSFYRCVEHGNRDNNMLAPIVLTKFRFTCPEGTVFDETIQICNYPYEVENLAEKCHLSVN